MLPSCLNYDDFLAKMRTEGYEIKEGKQLSFRAPGQERFTRSDRLGADYTRDALRTRSVNRSEHSGGTQKRHLRNGRKVNLLIDIQKKMAEGKGASYERWTKVFNLKEAAKTLNFLVDNGLTDYDELAAQVEQAGDRFDEAAKRIKQLEARMAEIAQLKTHIIRYSKTREIYAAYKKSRHKKEFLAEHRAEIAQHEASKRAFDALGGKPIPKVAQLSQEYAALLAEKQERYSEYKSLRQDMIDYRTMKQNVDKILDLNRQNGNSSDNRSRNGDYNGTSTVLRHGAGFFTIISHENCTGSDDAKSARNTPRSSRADVRERDQWERKSHAERRVRPDAGAAGPGFGGRGSPVATAESRRHSAAPTEPTGETPNKRVKYSKRISSLIACPRLRYGGKCARLLAVIQRKRPRHTLEPRPLMVLNCFPQIMAIERTHRCLCPSPDTSHG